MSKPEFATYLYITSMILVFWGAAVFRDKSAFVGCTILGISAGTLIASGFLIKDTLVGQDFAIPFAVLAIGVYIGVGLYGAS